MELTVNGSFSSHILYQLLYGHIFTCLLKHKEETLSWFEDYTVNN